MYTRASVVQLLEHRHREHGIRSDKSHQPQPAVQPGRQPVVVFGRRRRRRRRRRRQVARTFADLVAAVEHAMLVRAPVHHARRGLHDDAAHVRKRRSRQRRHVDRRRWVYMYCYYYYLYNHSILL